MRILLLSPYHGGSHRAWAEGYAANSSHDVRIVSLPARFWKWRMEGGAITLARLAGPLLADLQTVPDVILATDMLDLTRFLALTRAQTATFPALLYMHENQLTYPLPKEPGTGPMRRQYGERDRHYVLTNISSMLAANRVFFNSAFHREEFFAALPTFLRHYPEYNELEMIAQLTERSDVLPVGIDFARFDPPLSQPEGRPPLFLWNQRWEYDKNPARFVDTLEQLAAEGFDFEVAFCGERFGIRTPEADESIKTLGSRVIHNGYANAETYRRLLWSSAITFSTAWHEYFGISILEAIHCHTLPILPRRLSYPEIIPTSFHEVCLVDGSELLPRLRWALTHLDETRRIASRLASQTTQYGWPTLVKEYDRQFEAFLGSAEGRRS